MRCHRVSLRVSTLLPGAAVTTVVLIAWAWLPELAEGALRNAAGGDDGAGGFATLTRYLDRLASFLIPVGGAAAVIGVIVGGCQFIAGSPTATKTLGYVAVGVVIVLGSKGLAA
jgi:type IV secretory pathway VirB2 component (pilin)